MERTAKLAPLALVSKYYPIANYSYPRSEAPPSSSSSSSSSFFSRTPYNSRRSSHESRPSPLSPPPGLVDDRNTDSEASSSADDDDFRYHVHGGELWDSFLEAGHRLHGDCCTEAVEMAASASFEAVIAVPPVVPAKDYPALIASPQRIKRRPVPTPSQQSPWPLSDQGRSTQPRKPSPTYSVFPKMVTVPSGTCTRQSSSSQLSTTSIPAADAPCPPQKALPPPPPPPSGPAPPPPPTRPAPSQYRSASPRPRAFSPASLTAFQRPATSHGSRPASPMSLPYSQPPTPPPTAPLPALPPLSSRSPHPSTRVTSKAHNLRHTEAATAPSRPPPHTIRPHAYTSSIKLPPRPPPDPLPRSVFEYDTDSDDDDNNDNGFFFSSSASSATESPTLSFFRFHRRSQSPHTSEGILSRRRGSASKTPLHQAQTQQQQEQYFVDAAATAAKDRRRRRKRTNTMDSLPPLMAKQADLMLSRMLGRRSR